MHKTLARRMARLSAVLATGLVFAGMTTSAPAAAADLASITFVNESDGPIWLGSTVNADGSENLTGLPKIEAGQSATISVPENAETGYWRGKFFAREDCSGEPGQDFSCLVGDCGPEDQYCTTGEQPVSLAEFNFDTHDDIAPWYNVSYVNAVSRSVTIAANVASRSTEPCDTAGCTEDLLPHCPPENLQTHPETGEPMLCVNPNRDVPTPYSDAIKAKCPKAYAWSKQDTEPGNQTMFNCPSCSDFTVTFHGRG